MNKFRIIFVAISLFFAIGMLGAPTATQVMQKSVASLSASSGVTVGFRITGTQALSGTIVVQGKKFYLDAGNSKVWYDGSVMTTLNLTTGEATVTTPTVTEVNEAFPLSYVYSWNIDYSVAFARQQPKSGYCLVLTSRNSAAVAKKAVLTVNSSNFRPQKLVISLKKGGVATLLITSITAGGRAKANGFVYPAKKYPKIKIVDLR